MILSSQTLKAEVPNTFPFRAIQQMNVAGCVTVTVTVTDQLRTSA